MSKVQEISAKDQMLRTVSSIVAGFMDMPTLIAMIACKTIEKLVQATSELEARGSAVYTLALFRCLETEVTVPHNMFEQGFITACMRAVASDKPVVYAPSAVCLRYLQDVGQDGSDTSRASIPGAVQVPVFVL
jgi:hypothetical protein